jgi:hypothetical protein
MNKFDLINALHLWGSNTIKPRVIFEDTPSGDDEIEAKNYFSQTTWRDIEPQELQKYWNTATLLTPQAFRYFLPGIIIKSIQENVFNLFYDITLSPLDTGYGKKYLSERTISLWVILSDIQINLVIEWVFWLSNQSWFNFLNEDSILRIAKTLEEFKSNN